MFLNIDFFALGARFWQLLGGSWTSLGRLWAPKMASKRVGNIDGRQFLMQFHRFRGCNSIFLRFGKVWEGFWEGFLRGIGKNLGRFAGFLAIMNCLRFCLARRLGFLGIRTSIAGITTRKATNYTSRPDKSPIHFVAISI